jgi:hypothetical protein
MSREQHGAREAKKKPALTLKEKRAARKNKKDSGSHIIGAVNK